ncbi:MAG: hypothetical protein SFU87_08055 [Chitinophagaceae bacterium]|nr:hypothetical protein [Chitinophagaceae bacterium]
MKTGKIFLLLLAVMPSGFCAAQDYSREINEQVWKVQLQAMKDADAAAFVSVLSKDVVQISYDRKTIRNYAQFEKQVIDSYKRATEKKVTRNMEFRFVQRFATDTHAYENGYFRLEITNASGEKNLYYGAFQVVLRKENGVWKVLVDYDANSYGGKPITEELFFSAEAMEQGKKIQD